jgi:hypothetical protein
MEHHSRVYVRPLSYLAGVDGLHGGAVRRYSQASEARV